MICLTYHLRQSGEPPQAIRESGLCRVVGGSWLTPCVPAVRFETHQKSRPTPSGATCAQIDRPTDPALVRQKFHLALRALQELSNLFFRHPLRELEFIRMASVVSIRFHVCRSCHLVRPFMIV